MFDLERTDEQPIMIDFKNKCIKGYCKGKDGFKRQISLLNEVLS